MHLGPTHSSSVKTATFSHSNDKLVEKLNIRKSNNLSQNLDVILSQRLKSASSSNATIKRQEGNAPNAELNQSVDISPNATTSVTFPEGLTATITDKADKQAVKLIRQEAEDANRTVQTIASVYSAQNMMPVLSIGLGLIIFMGILIRVVKCQNEGDEDAAVRRVWTHAMEMSMRFSNNSDPISLFLDEPVTRAQSRIGNRSSNIPSRTDMGQLNLNRNDLAAPFLESSSRDLDANVNGGRGSGSNRDIGTHYTRL